MITFMDSKDYSQYMLNTDVLEEQLGYIKADLEGAWTTSTLLQR